MPMHSFTPRPSKLSFAVLALGSNSAHANSVIVVPVVPELDNNTSAINLDTVESPEQGTINSENIPIKRSDAALTSPNNVLAKIKGAEVSLQSNNSGLPLVRFRGTHAFEPAYFWDAIPLAGAYGGQQSAELLPIFLLNNVQTFPDSAPWWFPVSGTSGAINFQTFDDSQSSNVPSTNALRLNPGLAFGSYGFARAALVLGWNPSPIIQSEGGVQWERSTENFWVKNNNGTEFREDDDFMERRRNNDFSHVSTGFVAQGTVPQITARWRAGVVGGLENRGVGSQLSQVTTRLDRSLILSYAQINKQFPDSGIQQNALIAGAFSTSKLTYRGQTPTSFSPSKANVANVYAHWNGILPATFFLPGTWGAATHIARNSHTSERNSFAQEHVDAWRNEATLALYRSWLVWTAPKFSLSTDATLKQNIATSASQWRCASNSTNTACNGETSKFEMPLHSYLVSAQAKISNSIVFIRHSHLKRRPWLREIYGEVNGVYPNNNLLHEASSNLEIGAQNSLAQFTCFTGRDSNLIVLNGASAREGRYENINSVNRTGCTTYAEGRIFSWISPWASWRFTHATFASPFLAEKKYLPRTPIHSVQLGTITHSTHFEKYKLETQMDTAWQQPYFLDVANQIVFSPPVRLNAAANVSWRGEFPFNCPTRVGLEAKDLWNSGSATETNSVGTTVDVNHTGFSGFPSSGRRYILSLSLEI